MPVISCTHCGAKGNAPDSVLGQTVRCSKCKKSFVAGDDPPQEAAVVEEDADDGFRDSDEAPPPPRRKRGREDDEDEPAEEPEEDREEEPEDDAPPPARRKPKRGSLGPNVFLDIVLVRYYLGPYLLVAIFWIGSLYSIWTGFKLLINAFRFAQGEMLFDLIMTSLGIIVGGPIVMRVYCEFINAVFSIRAMLAEQIGERKK